MVGCAYRVAKGLGYLYIYMYIHDIVLYIYIYGICMICVYTASSNVCKIIALSGIIAGGIFSASKQFLHFLSFCMCLLVLKRRKNPTKPRNNPTKRRKQSRAQNVEIETAKKTGNGENISIPKHEI